MYKQKEKTMSKVPKLRFPEFEGEWEEKELENILEYERPDNYIVSDTNYSKVGIPVLTANKSFILGYTEENEGVFKDIPVIIFDDFTTDKKYVDFPFKVKSSAIKILKTKKDSLKFIYEAMSLIDFEATEHKRYYISAYQKIPLHIPSIAEQQKIADCLSSLDELIEARREKIASLKAYKKGLLQQLFPEKVSKSTPPPLIFNKLQKLRFTGFEGEWEEKKLGFFIKQKNDRNKKLHIKEVLSINNKKGFITQEEQFNGYEVASKNLSNYKIVKKGYFGYNPSRINVGSIAKLEKLEEGIVSPMYIVFEVDAKLNSSFLLFLFETKDFKDKIKENATGSVRDTLDFKDLSNFSFFFPTTEEQQKIADCLLSLDEKIVAETEQVAQLQQHKKGLLQQLLV